VRILPEILEQTVGTVSSHEDVILDGFEKWHRCASLMVSPTTAGFRMFRVSQILSVSALAVVIAGQAGPGTAQEQRRVVAESRFDITNAPDQAEVVQQFVHFAPGAWTSHHSHGGQAINLVLDGTIALRQDGRDRTYRAGHAWTDSTTQPHAAGNVGSGSAHLVTNFLLPKGATQTTAQGGSPLEPVIVYVARFALPALAADTEILQQVADLPPGWRAERISKGFVAGMVLDGVATYAVDAARKEYQPGEAWSAQAGAHIIEENRSGGKVRIFTTQFGPRGTLPD
jgi:quercetin dioxygenase-like cupin family protein